MDHIPYNLIQSSREELLSALNFNKPEGYKRTIRAVLKQLSWIDGLWEREHPEHRSSEMIGRRSISPRLLQHVPQ